MQKKFLTVNLRLPDGVCHTPEAGQDVEDVRLLRVGRPREEDGDAGDVDECAHEEDGHAADLLDDVAEAEGANGIANAEHDDDVADVLNSVGARDVAGGEVGAEEALFDARPKGQRDDEDLVGVLQVVEGGKKQRHAALLLLTLVLAISGRQGEKKKKVLKERRVFVAFSICRKRRGRKKRFEGSERVESSTVQLGYARQGKKPKCLRPICRNRPSNSL